MLLYTIMPYDAVFGPAQDTPRAETSPIPGGYVEWVKNENGCHISRVESTDPSVYLQKRYAVGAPWFPKG